MVGQKDFHLSCTWKEKSGDFSVLSVTRSRRIAYPQKIAHCRCACTQRVTAFALDKSPLSTDVRFSFQSISLAQIMPKSRNSPTSGISIPNNRAAPCPDHSIQKVECTVLFYSFLANGSQIAGRRETFFFLRLDSPLLGLLSDFARMSGASLNVTRFLSLADRQGISLKRIRSIRSREPANSTQRVE